MLRDKKNTILAGEQATNFAIESGFKSNDVITDQRKDEFKRNNGAISLNYRQRAAARVFSLTASYEVAISEHFNNALNLIDGQNVPGATFTDINFNSLGQYTQIGNSLKN